MAVYNRKRDFVIDEGVYKQDDITYYRAERSSKRTNNQSANQNHLFTCYMANKHFTKKGGEPIVPTCQPCAEFGSEVQVKKKLLGKNQFSTNIAKRFQCKWLLRRTIPSFSYSTKPCSPIRTEKEETAFFTHTQTNDRTQEKNTKRIRRNFAELEADVSANHEQVIRETKRSITDKFEKENSILANQIELEKSKLKKKESDLQEITVNLPLKDAFERILYTRYKRNDSVVTDSSEMASALCDVIMDVNFLDGECIHILMERILSVEKIGNSTTTNENVTPPKPRSLVDLIEKEYLPTIFKPGIHAKTKSRHVFSELCNDNFLNGTFDEFCKKQYEDVIKKNCPYNKGHKVCREMDLSGGVLNQSSINVLRKVEGMGKYGRDGYMCSTNTIKKIQKLVHDEMKKICPYVVIDADGIDGIKFNYDKLLDFILKIFKLDQIATEKGLVKMAITLDGADLSRNIQHVTCGIKIVDPRAVNPLTGIPIGLEGVQSRDYCFPFKILLTKDSKTLYQTHLKDFFDWTKQLLNEGLGAYKPFLVASPQDVSSFWKCIGRGGACKRDENFCHCCAITSTNVIVPNIIKCAHCLRFSNELCFHQPVCDNVFLENVKSELQSLLETHNHLFDRNKIESMTIKLEPNNVFAKEDISNIDFEPITDEDKRLFSQKLNQNLALLGLSRRGNRREILRQHLEALERKSKLEHALDNFHIEQSMIIIEQAIPCILHMENRVGEKILKMLLIEGANERDSDNVAFKEMIKKVNRDVNTKILGTQRRKSNWSVTLASDGTVGDQAMTNNNTRKIINGFEKLLPLCVSDPVRRDQWLECIELWRELVEIVRQKEDFTDAQIDSFQHLCDIFFAKWVALHKESGVGNYVHMIGAGHFSYYLRKWRNLYRYSQQGWEALNSQIKTVYFRRTQRGGHKGDGEFNSKVEPIAKWVQRSLFWKAGLDKMFETEDT